MAKTGKKILALVVGNLIVWGVAEALNKKLDGKTATGRKIDPKKKTYVDWKGNVRLGTNDYQIV